MTGFKYSRHANGALPIRNLLGTPAAELLITVGNSPSSQVVRRHFYLNTIARKYTNVMLAHLAA